MFNGHAFKPSFQYFFQLDADSDAAETVDMLDYYVTYDFGRDLFCCEKNWLALRFGKWKIGFNRAREESGTRMQFTDRSTASVLFDFDRGLGVGLLGKVGPLDWQVAVSNGIDTGGYRPSRFGSLDRNLAAADAD
ncbi:MAG: porin [Planctomycetales bacterium]